MVLNKNSDTDTLSTRVDCMEKSIERRFVDGEKSVSVALLAAEKATNAAFLAAEKAIEKAENAQSAYNERSNEFRQSLNDSQQFMVSRTEFSAELLRIMERIEDIKKELANLREATQQSAGKSQGISTALGIAVTVISLTIAAASVYFSR